jgi:hypothetical protein
MSLEIFNSALKDIGKEDEYRIATHKVAGKALAILKEYGEFKAISFTEHLKKLPAVLRDPFTREEAVNSHSVSGIIIDSTGNSAEIEVASFGKRKPLETSKISVKISNLTKDDEYMDRLLFTNRGWNIDVVVWDGSKSTVPFYRPATVEQLEFASQKLDLFRANLLQKRKSK